MKVGENRHVLLHLDAGNGPLTCVIHRFEISKPTGQSVSNSKMSIDQQRILVRCHRLEGGVGLKVCISSKIPGDTDAAGSQPTL